MGRTTWPAASFPSLWAPPAVFVTASVLGDHLRDRRGEWIALGVFAQRSRITRESDDRIVGLLLDHIAVDGCITEAPGGGEVVGRRRAYRAGRWSRYGC